MSSVDGKRAAAGAAAGGHTVRGFSLFMNWFNVLLAPFCGVWMMLSAVPGFPLSWESWMPLSLFDPFPLHELIFASYLLPGLALALVVGVPNIVALAVRRASGDAGWARVCRTAGALLMGWTIVELAFVLNALSVFYLLLGILQAASAAVLLHRAR